MGRIHHRYLNSKAPRDNPTPTEDILAGRWTSDDLSSEDDRADYSIDDDADAPPSEFFFDTLTPFYRHRFNISML